MLKESEVLLQNGFHRYNIAPSHRASIVGYLGILDARDPGTCDHSIRVGAYAGRIGECCGIPGVQPKPLFWGGNLHDIGKVLEDPDLFKKTGQFTEEDYLRMEPHVMYGWRMLREVHDYTAHIIALHHRFQARPYPKELPPLPGHLQNQKELIGTYGRLVALADSYDATMTRNNGKFGKALSDTEKREKYFAHNQDQVPLIEKLEVAGVFTFKSA